MAEEAPATAAPVSAADLLALLELVERGELGAGAAAERLERPSFRDLGFARIDVARERRQGAPEGILAEGKAPEEIEAIVRAMLVDGVSSVLVTRADDEARAAVVRAAPGEAQLDERARLAWVARSVPPVAGEVAIVSGGTADGPVVREVEVRAALLGAGVSVHRDAGVAGLARLEPALDDLRRADCVVVVAGLDAALASVVGGLVAAPVIGVPTSAGYGTAFGGITPLLAMLSSCAAGLATVGIDDGFGAGTIAARIARAAAGAA
ncbi:MAG: Circadian phase modifier [uncultured Solirubrobacterales bacterium]|uniref:Circadian phase modifier n=1 Tax=uncultured Solirubrobacterales bacterium TaxID=768556 RepID=A0A6J4SHU6_9ACTN|nr:MAG: Circadian phase modifier [uncultured Solirubrobacterales bacterium]